MLNAKVLRVFQGIYGLQMEFSGVKASRLDDFFAMLAGLSEQDYDRWVSQMEVEMTGPTMTERADIFVIGGLKWMKNATLTMSVNSNWLDALTFHMGKKDADLQAELGEFFQKLYEKYVPQATREYLDDRIAREENPRPSRPNRPRYAVAPTEGRE